MLVQLADIFLGMRARLRAGATLNKEGHLVPVLTVDKDGLAEPFMLLVRPAAFICNRT